MTLAHTDTLVHDSHYMDRLPRLAEQIAHSQLCPAPWRVEHGDPEPIVERKIADLTIVGMSLAELDMRLSVNTLPQVYVVHGRPGYMAQIQITLAARHGCRIVPLDDASDNTVGTVKAQGKDGQWHIITVTIADAIKAGWTKRNPNYDTIPDRMLMARAVTKAIGLHCPEAKLLLPDPDEPPTKPPGIPVAEAIETRWAETQTELSPGEQTVPPLEAKLALVDAFTNIGYTHTYAVTSASIVWHAQFRPHEHIKQSELDILLKAIADQNHVEPLPDPEQVDDDPERPF